MLRPAPRSTAPPAVPVRPAHGLLLALLALGAAVAAPTPATAQLAPDVEARVDSVFADLDRTSSPGCALGVTRDGRLAYAEGYGSANLDHELPITPASVIYMGSVSKQFVTAAVVVADRQGHLSLDDPVRRWVPELPEYEGPTITIRHLIHHTSGLRDFLSLVSLAGQEPEDLGDTGAYLALIARQEGLNFPPGEEYRYSNTNYFLLSEIVREATGSSLREFSTEHIFRPLGMRHTHFHDDRRHVVRNRATGYRRAGDGFEMDHQWDWEQVGSGGLYSSVEDMARWERNFLTEQVGGEGFVEQMTERGRLANGDTLDYAFALDIGEYRGLRTVGHGGSFPGFRTYFLRFPEAGTSVVVLCNLGSVDPGDRARRVVDAVMADRLAPEPEREEEAGRGGAWSPGDLSRYAGLFRSEDASYVRFVVEEGELAARLGPGSFPLEPAGPHRFRLPAFGVTLAFAAGDGNRASPGDGDPASRVALVSDGDTSDVYLRVEQAEYTAEERAGLAGTYYSPELDADYRILAEDGELRLARGRRDPEALRPGIRDEFRFGAGRLRVVRDDAGRVIRLVAGNDRAEGIRFERRR